MSTPTIQDCWKRIGIWGDRSCPELKIHLHCRNCPLYSAGATQLLDAEVSEAYLAGHARHYAEAKEEARRRTNSVVTLRVAGEWFALATAVFREITSLRPVHSLPHRRDRIVTGLVNIRGELLICVSLAATLGLTGESGRERTARLAVVSRGSDRFVFVADEVGGLFRFDDAEIGPVPATLAHAQSAYTRGLLVWRDRPVGLLDDQLLFYSLNRNLA
jgi:chemotaxis-related protein WspD